MYIGVNKVNYIYAAATKNPGWYWLVVGNNIVLHWTVTSRIFTWLILVFSQEEKWVSHIWSMHGSGCDWICKGTIWKLTEWRLNLLDIHQCKKKKFSYHGLGLPDKSGDFIWKRQLNDSWDIFERKRVNFSCYNFENVCYLFLSVFCYVLCRCKV